MKLAVDQTPLVLFIVSAPMFSGDVAWTRTLQKTPEANIQAILPKFIVNVIRQVRQKRILCETGNEL